jgi:hypothetical protein
MQNSAMIAFTTIWFKSLADSASNLSIDCGASYEGHIGSLHGINAGNCQSMVTSEMHAAYSGVVSNRNRPVNCLVENDYREFEICKPMKMSFLCGNSNV